MTRRPTIAVALYGLPRCSAVTFSSIEQQILAPLRRCGNVRVYNTSSCRIGSTIPDLVETVCWTVPTTISSGTFPADRSRQHQRHH